MKILVLRFLALVLGSCSFVCKDKRNALQGGGDQTAEETKEEEDIYHPEIE